MQKIRRTIKKRRKEGRTDYKSRLSALKSDNPRLVIRKTNRYILAQMVKSEIAQDNVIISVSSKELIKFGWPSEKRGSLKNRMACYLTGLLLAKRSKDKKANLDIGMQRNVHKGRIYSTLKGAIEGGMEIKFDEKALPDESYFEMEELKKAFEKIKEEIKKNG